MKTFFFLSALALPIAAEIEATFVQGTLSDTRRDRIPALRVDPGTPPSPFLEPGPFSVTWSGNLALAERQRLHFSFEGRGTASLNIAGEELLAESGELGKVRSEQIRLNPGEHAVVIRYQSPDDGSGHFRLFWEERSFPRQSIPPAAFSGAGGKPAGGTNKRQGRQLFAQANCSKCHLPSKPLGPQPMLEMQEIAPLLANTGGRLNEKWIAAWIASPRQLNPHTLMPGLIDPTSLQGRQQAADLAAWLATMKIADPPAAPDPALAAKGGDLFHQLACVACHNRPDASQPDPARVPLKRVADKFQPGALVEYLKNPAQWHPHTAMPDFGLADYEAQSLAAWLIASSDRSTSPDFPSGDASRGAGISRQLNCGSCHAGLPLDLASIPSLEEIFATDWTHKGCASANPASGLPDFGFDQAAADSLVAFSKTGPDSLGHHVPAEYATRQLEALRCINCHDIDQRPSLLSSTHGETSDLIIDHNAAEERLDQSRPHLTFIGEMLNASYIEAMLAGTANPRPRPWLGMKMPAFKAHSGPLADGLARLSGVMPGGAEPFKPDPEQVASGKHLVGSEGFGCNTCHAVGDTGPTAAFEVQGTNFDLAHRRLRREWYDRWIDNPLSVTPTSKMPRYSENGQTNRTDILEGDAARQFDAIWHYLMAVPENP